MKKILLQHCVESEEARLYDFINACNIIVTDKISTAGVNNKGQFFINYNFYEKNKDHIIGLIFHESLHIYFDHVNRKHDNHRIANIAQDIVINKIILDIDYTLPETPCTYESCDVPTYLKTSDEIYEHLMENLPPEDLNPEHDLPNDEEYDQGDVEEIERICKVIAADCDHRILVENRQKYNVVQKSDIVSSIERILGKFLTPDFKRTYSRPSRFKMNNVLLPSSRAIISKPTLSIYLDVSGSMEGDNIEKALGVFDDLESIFKAYKTKKYVFNTDTKSVDDFKTVEVGGGTSFDSFAECDNSDVVFIITDCEFTFDFVENHNRKSVIILSLGGVMNVKNCEVFSV